MKFAKFFIVCVTLSLVSCATTPGVGVRPDFEGIRLTMIAVPSTYSTTTFGLRAYERRGVERAYELAATRWLMHRGIAVIDAQTLKSHLTRQGVSRASQDELDLKKPLTDYFEAESTERKTQAVRALWDRGALPTRALLFTEVVYQSEGYCQDTEVVGPHHIVTGDAASDHPCIISHFQAKLIDAQTGATMWHNRALIEHRVTVSIEARARTIDQAIHQTFSGPFGFASLIDVSRQSSTR